MVDVSIIIPAYNAGHTLGDCLEALCAQSTKSALSIEIIVVDNGSTDHTAAVANQYPVGLVSETRKGTSWARNAGIEASSGRLICFTDADCVPTADWVEKITAPLLNDQSIIGAKGVYLTKQQEPVARFVQLEYEDKYDLLYGQESIDFIDTYSAIYRREPLVKHGSFDTEMVYLEDQELSFRLNGQGCRMIFNPNAVVYHLHADSLLSYMRKKITIGYWKAQVVRKYPQHIVQDSHTPQVMKVQMGLALLTGLALFLPIVRLLLFRRLIPPAVGWLPALAGIAAFVLTTVPFIKKAWAKDQAVAACSPIFLFARAVALSIGYIWGTLRPVKFQSTPAPQPDQSSGSST